LGGARGNRSVERKQVSSKRGVIVGVRASRLAGISAGGVKPRGAKLPARRRARREDRFNVTLKAALCKL